MVIRLPSGVPPRFSAGGRNDWSVKQRSLSRFSLLTMARLRHCAVFGASGFLGTNLCRKLAAQGIETTAFGKAHPLPGATTSISHVHGVLEDSRAVARAIEGADIVFNLIGGTTPSGSNLDIIGDLQANVAGMLRFLEQCRTARVKRVIFPSSGGTIYGRAAVAPSSEESETNPICAYGISKLAMEKYHHLYRYLYGLDYVALRISNPYGRYQRAKRNQGVIAAFLRQIIRDEPIEIWGTGSVVRDYVHVDDVVDALIHAAEYEGKERLFNIGSGIGLSLSGLVSEIQAVIGHPIRQIYRPARPVDVPVSVLNIERATREFGWKPSVTLRDGLLDTWRWMAAENERTHNMHAID
jgi:UDP-glucose 4-epimerase